ncbi:helix-turn-helix domain-containing protein [Flavobacterium rhizosphaerae]|uniref:AraC family transcriptional regulator n=1 Tax=Flavobacterium rhizosphaerae TaxID=3163298 RepID=A0ABW8YVZ0_9FLAO
MKLFIKNMVCPRCITSVQQVFEGQGIAPVGVNLGEVVINEELTEAELLQLKDVLAELGFELLEDTKSQIIERVKSIIIAQVQNGDGHIVFSDLLAGTLNKEYSSLSKVFSTNEGITIEQFIILQKIERVKELLTYNQMTLSEIANVMGYSSVAHLSGQFRKITGYTPTNYKLLDDKLRLPLDGLAKKV